MIQIINNVNHIIQTYTHEDNMLSPEKGNVFFTSAKRGWGFGIKGFADLYAKKTKSPKEKWQKLLWGEHYYDLKEKKMTTSPGLIITYVSSHI